VWRFINQNKEFGFLLSVIRRLWGRERLTMGKGIGSNFLALLRRAERQQE
jgi:hypothetical protein